MASELGKRTAASAAEAARVYFEPGVSASVLNSAFSYLYVALWAYTYWIRTVVIGKITTALLVILSVVELAGISGIGFPFRTTLRTEFELAAAVALCGVALVVTVNRTRLTRSLQRHDVALGSIRVLVEEGALDSASDPPSSARKILDALVFAAEFGSASRRVNATLMVRPGADQQFRIFAQDSRRSFDPDTSLDGSQSVAGAACKLPEGNIIYVPNARFSHGVEINLYRSFPAREYFRAMSIVPNVFQWLDSENSSLMRSLICVRVPTTAHDMIAVLCVSSLRPNSFGHVEMSITTLSAALLARVLQPASAG